MMRTQQEILARIEEVKEDDFFGFQLTELIEFLEFENAKPFLKDGVTSDEWQHLTDARAKMIDYMDFAWEKANGKRGISAGRTMDHYKSWLWLDGDETLWRTLDHYEYYGKPQLIEICKYLGLNAAQWDDGVRENE